MSSRPNTAMSLLGEGKRAKPTTSLLSRFRNSTSFESQERPRRRSTYSASANFGAMMYGGAIRPPPPHPPTCFRCDVYGTNGSDFTNAIEECQQLVLEAGGQILQEYTGGFVYNMILHRNKNPLDDNEPTERGGFINVSPWPDRNKAASYRPPIPPKKNSRAKSVASGERPPEQDQVKSPRAHRKGNVTAAKEKTGRLFAKLKQRVGSARRQPLKAALQAGELAISAPYQDVDRPVREGAPYQEEFDAGIDTLSIAVSALTHSPEPDQRPESPSESTAEQDSRIYVSPKHCRRCAHAISEDDDDEDDAASVATRGSINSSNYDWESAVIETARMVPAIPPGARWVRPGEIKVVDIPPRRRPRQQD